MALTGCAAPLAEGDARPRLNGVVDAMPAARTLGGWVRRTDQLAISGATVSIHDCQSGACLGTAPVNSYRADCGEDCGFVVTLTRPVSLEELRSGQVVVRARLPGAENCDLGIWEGLRALASEMQAVDRRFLRYCRQGGIAFRPGSNRSYDDLALEAPCAFAAASIGRKVGIGAHSVVSGLLDGFIAGTSIGRYCTIAGSFTIAPDEHPTSFLSSSMMQYVPNLHGWDDFLAASGAPRQAPLVPFAQRGGTVIGNDVWVGAKVFIRQGVTIGDGAILAAGAVVVADVAPYSVVGGVPARVIRQRFSDGLVARLLALRWWDYDVLAVAGLRFDVPTDAVSLLEDRLAAGALAALPPHPVTLAALHKTWLASTSSVNSSMSRRGI